MKRMQNKINYFELFSKDKVVCFLLLIHNISKRLDNTFNKFISLRLFIKLFLLNYDFNI